MIRFFNICFCILLLIWGLIQIIPSCDLLTCLPLQFQKYYVKNEIKKYCDYYNRNYKEQIYDKITDAIILGKKEYKSINYKTILTIISIESQWKIYAYNKNNNNTCDYGLTQQNSNYLELRYNKAKEICKKYNVKFSNSKYDITLNILSAYIYLNDIQKQIKCEKQQIIAYNTGIHGSYKYIKNIDKFDYYQKFYKLYNM